MKFKIIRHSEIFSHWIKVNFFIFVCSLSATHYIYIHIYIYIYIYIYICLVSWVFANGLGELIPPYLILRIIRYVSRVKWNNPGKVEALSLHLGVVAIEKGTFELPTLLYILFYTKKVFLPCVCWWSFTWSWVTTSLLRSPGLVSVF